MIDWVGRIVISHMIPLEMLKPPQGSWTLTFAEAQSRKAMQADDGAEVSPPSSTGTRFEI